MAQARIDFQTTTDNAQTEVELSIRLRTSINDQGETVYYAPVEVKNRDDLRCLGISWDDCRTLHFGQSEKKTVYYLPTTNKAFAEMQWTELNSEHSKGYRSSRCLVPGKLKAQIVCPDTNKCSECPYHRNPEDRQAQVISWDELITGGYEPESEDRELAARMAWLEFEEVKKVMDAKDPNIARVMVLKEMQGYEVSEIAAKLKITERQTYYCIQQAKQIGKKYKKMHG